MIDVSLTMTVIWLLAGLLLMLAAGISWITYCDTRYVAPYAFALSTFLFGVSVLLSAFARSPWGHEYAMQLIVFNRAAMVTGAVLQFLAVDALAASYNAHRSLLNKALRPIERWYDRLHEGDTTWHGNQ